MHTGHQLLYGMCVRLCCCISCGVGCTGCIIAFALFALCCSSSSSVGISSLYSLLSSKVVDPVHSCCLVGCGSVVQSSSILLMLCSSRMCVALYGSSL